MSEKKAEASRTNGSKSAGPKSQKGKDNIRFNALAGGLFAKQLVIPALGESPEEFDRIKNEIWSAIQPTDLFQQMLTIELVETWWRRQRIRRGAAAEVRLSAAQIEMEDGMRRADEVVSLKNKFWHLIMTKSVDPRDREEVRSQLVSTSGGLEFLIETITRINAVYAQKKTALEDLDVAVLTLCCGPGDTALHRCYKINRMIRAAVQELKSEAVGKKLPNEAGEADKAERVSDGESLGLSPEECMQLLQNAIADIVKAWVQKRKLLVEHERVQKETQITAAALPSSETLDRISRAEAAIDRRFHRALVLLLTLKSPQGNPKFLSA